MTHPTDTSEQLKRGLEGVIAADTAVSKVDGANCQLIYRGYSIDQLASQATYEETAYLLLFGSLPTRMELSEWSRELAAHRTLAPEVLNEMQTFPHTTRPMAVLRTVVSMLGMYDQDAEAEGLTLNRKKAICLIAALPTIVSTFHRFRNKLPIVQPHKEMGHAENFLYMLHEQAPSALATRCMDTYWTLLAEHGLNASTFAGRVVVGTKSDVYSAVTAAIGTLKGPLHGAANRKAMEMLLEVGSPNHIDAYVAKVVESKSRFMGFGHRVYKGEDPRAPILKALCKELGEATGELKWYTLAEQLQTAVQAVKPLAVNVDYYSAPLLYYLGIPVDCFTTMFACSRIAGWSAHALEQYADNRLIRPLGNYIGPRDLQFVPIDQRKPA